MIHSQTRHTHGPDADTTSDCEGCPLLPDRRTFFRGAALAAGAAALAALGAPLGTIAALPIANTTGRRRHGPLGDTIQYTVPQGDGAQVDKDNQVILVRWQSAVYAFALSCPHQNTALRWEGSGSDSRFQCPKHHSKYQPDGTFISGRATRNMDRFTIRRDGDKIVVDMDALHKSSDDPTGWSAAVVKLDGTGSDTATKR